MYCSLFLWDDETGIDEQLNISVNQGLLSSTHYTRNNRVAVSWNLRLKAAVYRLNMAKAKPR